jgi:hypothetical protein
MTLKCVCVVLCVYLGLLDLFFLAHKFTPTRCTQSDPTYSAQIQVRQNLCRLSKTLRWIIPLNCVLLLLKAFDVKVYGTGSSMESRTHTDDKRQPYIPSLHV